jgi:hypothetical protein
LLAELFGQPLSDQPGDDVGRAAGRISDDEANWPRRVIERQGIAARLGEGAQAKRKQTHRGTP